MIRDGSASVAGVYAAVLSGWSAGLISPALTLYLVFISGFATTGSVAMQQITFPFPTETRASFILKIRKRDGREAPFNIEKIATAVRKALHASGEVPAQEAETVAMDVSEVVVGRLAERRAVLPSIEQVQDLVELVLAESGYTDTAKRYILYRAERTRVRERDTRLMGAFRDIVSVDAGASDIKRENANIDGDTAMGAMLKFGSEGAKHYYESFMLKPEHAEAHRSGDIHIHDLDFYSLTTTCCQIDLMSLFRGGFSTGHGHLREPRDIRSYSALACIAIQSNQNDQHGGQSVGNFDYGMARGVANTYRKQYARELAGALRLLAADESVETCVASLHKRFLAESGLRAKIGGDPAFDRAEHDALTAVGFAPETVIRARDYAAAQALRETDIATYQAMEALIHNLNSMHSRAGAQVPFSSINYGMDTSPEGRLVIRNLLLATESGLGNGETPIFPIQVFRVKSGVNFHPGDPNHDLFRLACRVSAKRLFPNFAFQDAPFNLRYYKPGRPETEIAYMGCRTRVIGNVHDPEREQTLGRGNLSFTSINLPRLAITAKGDLEKFHRALDAMMALVTEQLFERFEVQARKRVRNYPFLMGQGVWLDSEKLGPDDELREVLKHGTLTLGFIGLAECLTVLTGRHHGECAQAQQLGLDIIGRMRAYTDALAVRHRLNFSLIATPAEGLSGRFVRIDRKKYGVIPGVTDKDYYTNSFHVPVRHRLPALEKIRIEAPYHELTNAGHITYVELDGDTAQNPEAFEKIIRAMHAAGIGYGSVNHPVDRDPVCGYSGVIHDACPRCGRTEADGQPKFERIRRITGYLVGTVDRFNDAKRAEERERVRHATAGCGE